MYGICCNSAKFQTYLFLCYLMNYKTRVSFTNIYVEYILAFNGISKTLFYDVIYPLRESGEHWDTANKGTV